MGGRSLSQMVSGREAGYILDRPTNHAQSYTYRPSQQLTSLTRLWGVGGGWRTGWGERERKAAMSEKQNVMWPSGSWPVILATISAHITKMTILCLRLIMTWVVLPLWLLHFSFNIVPFFFCFVFVFSLQCWTTSVAPSKSNIVKTLSMLTCHSTSFLQTHIKWQVRAAAKICRSQSALRVPKSTVRTRCSVPPLPRQSSHYPRKEALKSHRNTKVKVPRRGH